MGIWLMTAPDRCGVVDDGAGAGPYSTAPADDDDAAAAATAADVEMGRAPEVAPAPAAEAWR